MAQSLAIEKRGAQVGLEEKKWKLAKNSLRNIVVLFLFFLFWHILAKVTGSAFRFVPAPVEVYDSFKTLIIQGDLEGFTLVGHIWASLTRILAGFFLSCVTAIPLGLATGLWPSFYRAAKVIIEPLRFIPPIAWIPLAIVLLVGFTRYTFLIFLGIFFPIWINTMSAIPQVNAVYINVAKVNGCSSAEIIRKVIWPSILPDILSGMRIGLGVGWMAIVAAEMVGGEAEGIGCLILKYTNLFQFSFVAVGMITVGIIGYAMNEILIQIEKKIFSWRPVIAV